jgi:hypothetical protein
MKKMFKIVGFICLLSVFLSIGGIRVFAVTKENTGAPVVSERFISEAEWTIIQDSNGEPIILFSLEEQQPVASRFGEKHYVRTMVAVFPSDEQEMAEIMESVVNTRATSPSTAQGWFFGSSVFVSSANYYTTYTSGSYTYGKMTKVTITCSVNSGTTIQAMTLSAGQNGVKENGDKVQDQYVEYDAKTVRTFDMPTSWASVRWGTVSSVVGSRINATAVRPSGETGNVVLWNNCW